MKNSCLTKEQLRKKSHEWLKRRNWIVRLGHSSSSPRKQRPLHLAAASFEYAWGQHPSIYERNTRCSIWGILFVVDFSGKVWADLQISPCQKRFSKYKTEAQYCQTDHFSHLKNSYLVKNREGRDITSWALACFRESNSFQMMYLPSPYMQTRRIYFLGISTRKKIIPPFKLLYGFTQRYQFDSNQLGIVGMIKWPSFSFDCTNVGSLLFEMLSGYLAFFSWHPKKNSHVGKTNSLYFPNEQMWELFKLLLKSCLILTHEILILGDLLV